MDEGGNEVDGGRRKSGEREQTDDGQVILRRTQSLSICSDILDGDLVTFFFSTDKQINLT
jgi:hypothetical protein